ncbi:tetratricopeptide repeat protein [Entomomonas asaccharolytica]|uniref:Uncharacterized protein n=1 Tax=Entomomonas asaccharolytica TaxID=2785331 RepID=A0A974NDV5_9GAMM|nr:hypothetical protein [Entomomonas asaccharolytica]QQP84779.1 hypothetical protein JHT90_10240 [Entomomonas asaccharolytica]
MSDNDSISQKHFGNGDNFLIYNVQKDIDSSHFKIAINRILRLLSEYHVESAKDRIIALKQTANLTDELSSLLDVVELKAKIADYEKIPDNIRAQLIEALNKETGDWERDIILSVLISIELTINKDDAIFRIKKEEKLGIYTKEIYYSFLATREELCEVYQENYLNFSQEEFFGLFSGITKLNDFELATDIARKFNEIFPDSYNASLCLLWSRYNSLVVATDQTWLLTYSQKKEAEKLIKEAIKKIKETSGDNLILFIIAQGLKKAFADLDYKDLDKTCWRYIDKLERYYVYCQDYIKYLEKLNNPAEEKDFLECHAVVINGKVTISQLFILVFRSSPKEITNILDSYEIEFDTDNELEKEFFSILLLCCSYIDNLDKQKKLHTQTQSLINKYKEQLKQINQEYLRKFIHELIIKKEYVLACKILEILLPEHDLWASPLVLLYVQALLDSRSMKTLNELLKQINNEGNDYLYQAQAIVFERQGNLKDAISSIQKAIKINSQVQEYWQSLLMLCHKDKLPDSEVSKILDDIPESFIKEPTQFASSLLFEIARIGNFKKTEHYLIKWFIQSPENSARYLMNIWVNLLSFRKDSENQYSDTVDDCIKAVQYIKNGKKLTQLIVKEYKGNSPYILSDETPIGKALLLGLKEKKIIDPLIEIELLKELKPFIAALHISVEIRQLKNDGTDFFGVVNFDENNPEKALKKIQEIMVYQNNKLDGKKELLANNDIPMLLKAPLFQRDCSVKKAIDLLRSQDVYKHALFDLGIEDPKEVIVDLYTICYLVITGLISGIGNIDVKFYISLETKLEIDNFINYINKGSYAGFIPFLDKEQPVSMITASDFKQQQQFVVDGLQIFLEHSEVLFPNLIDTRLVALEDYDPILFSTVQIVVSTKKPWLCCDGALSAIFHNEGEIIVNAASFLSNLNAESSHKSKMLGLYLCVETKLPFPLLYEDITELLASINPENHLLASKLIRNTCIDLVFGSRTTTFFIQLIFSILNIESIYLEHVFNGILESVIYSSIGNNIILNVEEKFAIFLNVVARDINNNEFYLKKLSYLGTKFAKGHFMDVVYINKCIQNINLKGQNSK